ncbi:RNA polymerase sigma factor [Vreelandella olivaria]|uniref:RNA polymerase sigma factor n=1 Tax=Vreelandella olivaria TaxID=390919 RepID=UPI00201F353F|nr:RNA polymerase sigma factor [Halomonas olivaria]
MTKSTSALLRMFQHERQRLVKRIRQVVGSTSVAEDLVQDTFVKLWQRPLKEADSPGLLHRTAHHLALDYLRAQEVRQRHHLEELDNAANEPPQAPSPEQISVTLQQWQTLTDQLDTLPERAKQVFLLNRVEGETYTAIAERMGLSISTVEKDMMRAMRLCRQWQQQYADEEKRCLKRCTNNATSHSDKR